MSGVEWTYYEAGPKSVDSPIIFLPPICGTADIFYKQILSLSALQYRSVQITTGELSDLQSKFGSKCKIPLLKIFGNCGRKLCIEDCMYNWLKLAGVKIILRLDYCLF